MNSSVIVYFSGLYKPKSAAVGMFIASLALVTGTVTLKYPPAIKGILFGLILALIIYHLLIIMLRKFKLDVA